MKVVDAPPLCHELCPSRQSHLRRPPSHSHHLDLSPGNPCTPTRPQSLQDRFLGGETRSKVHLWEGTTLTLGHLLRRVESPAKPIPVTGQGGPHPRNRNQVCANRNNHR